MARRPRQIIPGVPHHFTQRGNNRQVVFDTDADHRLFLRLLARYSERYLLQIWAYCLMPNHFHLVAVPTLHNSASRALSCLESDYARYRNMLRQTSGHLWQSRFFSIPMDPAYCWRAVAYVERNPVRAGIVQSPDDFRWSSAAARSGRTSPPAWLNLYEWHREWSLPEWLCLLNNAPKELSFREELHQSVNTGFPLGEPLAAHAASLG